MFDTKIVNGRILDGTGAAAFAADVAIAGDTLAAIGDLAAASANEVVDAAGCVVCPGFIDAHTHSDAFVLIEPTATSKAYQGITTEICGNCGASAAPIADRSVLPSDWADQAYAAPWTDVASYRARLEAARPALNVVLLVGHNTLRRRVIGYEPRAASPAELGDMARLLETALEQGARGLSTGLIYPPGMYAAREELVRLARLVGARDGMYASHMRSEGDALLEALDETLSIGREADVRVQVSHLKVTGQDNWGKIDNALDRLRVARGRGEPVAADRYPYTAGATELDVVFPDWAAAGGRAATLARLRDAGERNRIREAIQAAHGHRGWDGITIGSTTHPDNTRFRGMPLPAAAAILGMDPVDAILHFAETDELRTGAFFAGMSEANMRRILREPYVMIGSDASLRAPDGPLSRDYPHPRAYGSVPRFLRMCLDEHLLALPEAIRKLTSLPAAHFGIRRRGRLARGYQADVVVFDPGRVIDRADYGRPHRLAEGITHVFVNGVRIIADGRMTDRRGGRFLD